MTLRIFIAGTALTLLSCGTPATTSAPEPQPLLESIARSSEAAADTSRRVLDIPARDQAPERPAEGWCAETAIQESMLHFGAYAPQRDINRAGKPRNPDLYWDDVPVALEALGVAYTRWSGKGGQAEFSDWVEAQLAAGHPVIAGVKIYPTDHPRWGLDHIVLIIGVDDSGAMLINTTWGYRLRRSKSQLASTRDGISLANRYDRQFAYAITGFENAANGPTVRLDLERESESEIAGVVRLANLSEGATYQLRRIDAHGRLVDTRRFDASAASGTVSVRLDPDHTARFEISALD